MLFYALVEQTGARITPHLGDFDAVDSVAIHFVPFTQH